MGVQGRAVDAFLKEVMRWQLDHPDERAEVCREHMTRWIEVEQAAGRLSDGHEAAKPVGKKRKTS